MCFYVREDQELNLKYQIFLLEKPGYLGQLNLSQPSYHSNTLCTQNSYQILTMSHVLHQERWRVTVWTWLLKFCCSLAPMKDKNAESFVELQTKYEDVAHLGTISLFESISTTSDIFHGLHVQIHSQRTNILFSIISKQKQVFLLPVTLACHFVPKLEWERG